MGMGEKSYRKYVEDILQEHWVIYREVTGIHFSGQKLRIDAIVTPRDATGWKSERVALGIEFKDGARIASEYVSLKDQTQALAQGIDYANTVWEDFGYIYIFVCPGLFHREQYIVPGDTTSQLLSRIMGHLGVGELRFHPKFGLSFLLQETHRIWSQVNGVESGKFWNLQRTAGSR